MKYIGEHSDIDRDAKTGILLLNLGTPDKPNCSNLRKYLAQFLMDPRVVEVPALIRLLLVRGIIVNTRSHKSAAAYRKVWTEKGSPLLIGTRNLTDKVRQKIGGINSDSKIVVDFAMRYGKPSIKSKVKEFHEKGVRKLIVIPLYPQYSGSSSGTAFDDLAQSLRQLRWIPDLHFVNSYYQRTAYISAISSSIKQHWQTNGKAALLVMSFHGVPKKFIDAGDPYQNQCQKTAALVAQELSLKDSEWKIVYQSRLGKTEWIKPYCDLTIQSLPAQGIKSIDMICPGFSIDCLETLEEIRMENKNYFLTAGGEKFNYISCLNDSVEHAQLFTSLIKEHI